MVSEKPFLRFSILGIAYQFAILQTRLIVLLQLKI